MIRQFLSVFFLLTIVLFNAQAQDSGEKSKALATSITQYINAKAAINGSEQLTDEQTEKIQQAYMEYYTDRSNWKTRKKEFKTAYKTWKKAVSTPVSPEEKEKLLAQQKELTKENKAINQEVKDMPKRRDDKIKEALDENQRAIFVEMREEQQSTSDKESDKK